MIEIRGIESKQLLLTEKPRNMRQVGEREKASTSWANWSAAVKGIDPQTTEHLILKLVPLLTFWSWANCSPSEMLKKQGSGMMNYHFSYLQVLVLCSFHCCLSAHPTSSRSNTGEAVQTLQMKVQNVASSNNANFCCS